MPYTAILQVTGTRLDKFATFATEAEAAAHAAAFSIAYPDAFVVETLATPPHTWLCDAVAQTATAAAPPTDAERAAPLALKRVPLLLALDAALGLTTSDQPVEAYVASAISASTTLSDAEKRTALTLLASAAEFHRSDPDHPGLLDAIGAEIGLTSAQIDTLFLQTAGLGA